MIQEFASDTQLMSLVTDTLHELTTAASELGAQSQRKDLCNHGERKKKLEALEQAARKAVDASVYLQESRGVIRSIIDEETARIEEAESGRMRRQDDDDDDHGDGDSPGDGGGEAVAVEEGLWARFRDGYEKGVQAYGAKSDREKYVDMKEYVDFRRTVWDAENPNTPMPNPRLWFKSKNAAAEQQDEGENSGEEEESGDEVEVAQIKQSYKCPITMRYFKEPVTSTLCPHSFEKYAIYDMVQRGAVDCPMPGCSQKLSKKVLLDDNFLLQKMKRHLERSRKQREREDMDDGDDGSVLYVDEDEDDDSMSSSSRRKKSMIEIKKEKTARLAGRPRLVDPDEDDDGDDE